MNNVILGNFIDIISGGTPSTKVEKYWNGDILWISINDFTEKYTTTTEKKISIEGLNNSAANITLKDDIIISARGTVGKLTMVNSGITFNQSCYGLRTKNEDILSQQYLYYLLKYCMENIKKITHGSVFDTITRKTFENIYVNIPTIEKQKEIADRISVYDDKIENNNKIINTLEEMASLLYKRYFVDFEFPNDEGKPYKSNGGQFIDSELGEIPSEWKINQLGNLCDTILGGTPSRKKAEYWGGDINWINSGKMTDIRITKCTEKITKEGLKNSATKLMNKGTVVLGITGYLSPESITIIDIDTCANQSVIGVVENEKFSSSFIYLYLKNTAGELYKNKTGSAQQHINKGDVNAHLILIPDTKIYDKILLEIEPIIKQVSNLCIENDVLVDMRDLLINELIK